MKKYKTSTLTTANEVVPWLSATGSLAYTPDNPPDRDSLFQYGWVMPEIFSPTTERRKHYYFGEGLREDAREVFTFWKNARAGKVDPVAMKLGRTTPFSILAPIAVYRHENPILKRRWLMLIQHGSYQYVDQADQPEIERGIVYLYRGIQKTDAFRYLRFDVSALLGRERSAWLAFLKTQAQVLSDSVISFNSIHDRASRSETTQINDRSWMTDEIAKSNGLKIDDGGFDSELWANHQQSFSMERWVAEKKFGPNFVICKTPITNIRITTFFAGEAEAKVIDPNKLELVKAIGCQWNGQRIRGAIYHSAQGPSICAAPIPG